MALPKQGFTIQEILEARAEEEWRREKVPESDIEFSRLTGMDAGDIRGFRKFTSQHPGYLIIVRCPKVTARPHHRVFGPKPGFASGAKSGTSGLLVFHKDAGRGDGSTETRLFVSDYDLMCVWRRGSTGWVRIAITAEGGKKKGRFSEEATKTIRELNWSMESRSRIMHGCQDDWVSPNNPGVKPGDRFAVFNEGKTLYFDSPSMLGYYYRELHLPWPYNGAGKHIPAKVA
jgi:hypothetical protein